MKRIIIFGASRYTEKYYFDPITDNLPYQIKKEIKEIGVYFVNKISGIFNIGFYEDGTFFMEHSFIEEDFECDEIGAKLEIEKIKKDKKELISSLILWGKIVKINERE